ncbi:hypothetical protein [uncultured Acidaminococcus sp.]|jgi:hypothetical protein|uniref:hypothetical protein n=1 Tax=uncultured Acidaminococcus sp. TaxID=352152 RepID=UPI0025890EC7|nr:hypothetical protein [uncultured Acidaminococcus sp.]
MKKVAGIVIGVISIWLLVSSLYFYDGSRYEISKYEGKYWLHDDVRAFTIEKDGQSLQWDRRYIYSYGKSGFVIIDKKDNTLRVLFDRKTDEFQKNSMTTQEKRFPEYLQIISSSDMNEREKNIYHMLQNTSGTYEW